MDLFTDHLATLRKRRANVGAAYLGIQRPPCVTRRRSGTHREERLRTQYRRTFYALTAIECRIYERIGR